MMHLSAVVSTDLRVTVMPKRAEAGDVSGNPVAARDKIMRRISDVVPRRWVPAARRGVIGVAAYLPAGLRGRLRRAIAIMRPEMSQIERDYPAWVNRYDRIDPQKRSAIAAQLSRLRNAPVISVVMPVFDPVPEHLRAAVNSVVSQLYPAWELCISDDASTDPAVIAILRQAAERDHRIKLVHRERNGHISAASNSALQLATGQFVALLDHDDVLPPNALHEVAARIMAQPDVDIIYSDEDHIDHEGRRSYPYFKPDWDPDLMLGQNVISHLGVYRRSLVEQIGGFRTGFEGSQDYDLALRMVAQTRPERIAHIPKVLYHWRQGAGDPTFSEASQDRCLQNGRRAVGEFVARSYPDARVEQAPGLPGRTRVVYPLPEPPPLVSVIVSGAGSSGGLAAWAERLLKRTDYPAVEVLFEGDAVGETKRREPSRVRFLAPSVILQQARGSLILQLNFQLEPTGGGWLREMVSHAVRRDVGAVGAKLLATDGTVRHAGIVVGGPDLVFMPFVGRKRTHHGYFGHLRLVRDVTAVSSACMMIRRDTLLAAGGRDQTLSVPVLADVDFCLRLAESGLRTVWTPYAELRFAAEAPQRAPDVPGNMTRDADRLRQRWGSRLDADRYWNRNLSFDALQAGLAFPPRAASAADCHETPPVVLAL